MSIPAYTDEQIATMAKAAMQMAVAGIAETPKKAIGSLIAALHPDEPHKEKVALAERVYANAKAHASEWPLSLP